MAMYKSLCRLSHIRSSSALLSSNVLLSSSSSSSEFTYTPTRLLTSEANERFSDPNRWRGSVRGDVKKKYKGVPLGSQSVYAKKTLDKAAEIKEGDYVVGEWLLHWIAFVLILILIVFRIILERQDTTKEPHYSSFPVTSAFANEEKEKQQEKQQEK